MKHKGYLFLLLIWITACEAQNQESRFSSGRVRGAQEDPVIVTINRENLTRSDYQDFLHFTQGELIEDPSSTPQTELFREFVIRRLLLQEAIKENVSVEQAEVEEYVSRWTGRETSGDSTLKNHVQAFLKIQKYLYRQFGEHLQVSLHELQNYYEQHADEFVVEDQVHVLEILVRTRQEARNIRAALLEGDPRQFREMAREHSVGVTASSGGDLGSYTRGDLPPDFEKIIFELRPGEISSVFQSSYGYHIFLVEEWIPRHSQKFFEVQPQLYRTLVVEKERTAFNNFLNQILQNASIEVKDPVFKSQLEEDFN